ncbi:MAG: helix-turn-helix domain-containing protein [Candidatus Hodarchaeota archaeon]
MLALLDDRPVCQEKNRDARNLSAEKDHRDKIMWSRKHEKCIRCGTTKKRYAARGLCTTCYSRYIEKKHSSYPRKVRGIGGWFVPGLPEGTSISSSKILTKEYLLEEYVSKNRSVRDIAKDCYCSKQTVYRKLASHDIELRDRAYAKRIKYNEEFFTSWSPKMAYVLGVICTDGCLFPGRVKYCTITQKEPELLRKVLDLMDSKAKIYFSKQRVYGGRVSGSVHRVHIYSDKIYEDLIGLGLMPTKSHKMRFPEVPPEYMRHFIRGCWDGDGTVNISKYRSRQLNASFDTGSLDFIQKLVQELDKIGVCKLAYGKAKSRYPLIIHKRGRAYKIRVVARESLENLFHYLYDGVDESLYLKRKYETFLQGLSPKPITPRKTLSERVDFWWKALLQIMKEERQKKDISKSKVAEAMGISKWNMSLLESGKRGVPWTLWVNWCSALGISPGYVIERWQRMGGFEITSRQQINNSAGGRKTINITINREESHKKLVQILRRERKKRGLSQEEVSREMLVSKQYLSLLESRKREALDLFHLLNWCRALGMTSNLISEALVLSLLSEEENMEKYRQKVNKKRDTSEQLEDQFEDRDRPIEISLVTAKPERKGLSEEEFVIRAIKKLRKPPHKGIHTVYSGFNDAWRKHFGTDPVKGIQELAQQGKIEIRPAKKGGAIIYLPGEGPEPKNVLDIILD